MQKIEPDLYSKVSPGQDRALWVKALQKGLGGRGTSSEQETPESSGKEVGGVDRPLPSAVCPSAAPPHPI